MSQVYEGYERQYCELFANLSTKCNSTAALPDGEKKKQEFSELQAGLNDADVLIRKMDLEARSLQPIVKATLLAKLRVYKSDLIHLNKMKWEVKRQTIPTSEELLESGMAGGNEAYRWERQAMSIERLDQSTNRLSYTRRVALENEEIGVSILEDVHQQNQRERLAMSTMRLDQSTERLRDSRRVALETEEIGVSILDDLHQQRQTLLHSHNKLSDVDSAIDGSNMVLSSMSNWKSRVKWIAGFTVPVIIVVLVVIVVILI